MAVYAVILAGGRGERFWPLSRGTHPKQFLRLTSDKMMLEETIDRILPYVDRRNIRVVTGQAMTGFVLDSLTSLEPCNLLGEPIGRNTCAAIALAATHLQKEDPEAVLVVLSADHLIRPADKLLGILKEGVAVAAEHEYLITIGIVPTRPEIGYGYIKVGKAFEHHGTHEISHVDAFTEKPSAPVAREYYFSNRYLWNSGMFIWSARAILNAINECQPQMAKLFRDYAEHIGTSDEETAREEVYKKAVSISIDFAVLENADNVLVMKGDIVWDDIGDWNALSRYKDRNLDNNVLVGQVKAVDTYEATIYNEDDGIIATLGVSDLVVVRTKDITLVVHKTRTTDIKKLLKELGEDETLRRYL